MKSASEDPTSQDSLGEGMTVRDPVEWVVLAQLLRPQGRKGELLAELLTDFPERFADRPEVLLATRNFVGKAAQARAVSVESFWLPVGKNAGRIVLQFAGVDSIEAAQAIAGLDVVVALEDRLPLEEGAAYVSDLVGCAVFDGEVEMGVVEDVQFPANADGRRLEEVAPLLTVTGRDGGEILIPFANDFLVKLDVEARRIWMRLPEGLVDVNR